MCGKTDPEMRPILSEIISAQCSAPAGSTDPLDFLVLIIEMRLFALGSFGPRNSLSAQRTVNDLLLLPFYHACQCHDPTW
jgi:hypothetical protein